MTGSKRDYSNSQNHRSTTYLPIIITPRIQYIVIENYANYVALLLTTAVYRIPILQYKFPAIRRRAFRFSRVVRRSPARI